MFTTMCLKEQQTSDNLIVKDNCFIIEIFDKCSFSGILRGCLVLFGLGGGRGGGGKMTLPQCFC